MRGWPLPPRSPKLLRAAILQAQLGHSSNHDGDSLGGRSNHPPRHLLCRLPAVQAGLLTFPSRGLPGFLAFGLSPFSSFEAPVSISGMYSRMDLPDLNRFHSGREPTRRRRTTAEHHQQTVVAEVNRSTQRARGDAFPVATSEVFFSCMARTTRFTVSRYCRGTESSRRQAWELWSLADWVWTSRRWACLVQICVIDFAQSPMNMFSSRLSDRSLG